jgi:hypothetical protein
MSRVNGSPSEISSELSLAASIRKFQAVTADERRLHVEHKRLLRGRIDQCIEQHHEQAVYEVPKALSGAFPSYDVNEMTLWLIKQCRNGGLQAQVLSDKPMTIRVWGWYDPDWLERDGPPKKDAPIRRNIVPGSSSSSSALPQPPRKKYTAAKKKPTTTPRITTEQASRIAQQGGLSQSLRNTLARTQK